MKTLLAYPTVVIGLLGVLVIQTGCTHQTVGGLAPDIATTNAAPAAILAENAPAIPQAASGVASATFPGTNTAPTTTSAVAPLIISNPPPTAAEMPESIPQNVRMTPELSKIIRLAHSGLDEAVILNYISNAPAMFMLGAEEIVYLNDLGFSSATITAMMQRDQVLKNIWAGSAQAVAVAELEAAAPTYESAPEEVPVDTGPPVVSEDYFYDTLSPYGTWVEIGGYGRCWRPAIVSTLPTWRPYCDRGRWIYTDAGWYWLSDYSWGSVVFHYGRWFNHPRWGWCWWPNTVWGPSWVTWRYDSDYCGWAPLPPNSVYTPGFGFTYYGSSVGVGFDFRLGIGAFTFVSWGRVCDPYPYRYCLPYNRCAAVYNRCDIVNSYGKGPGNTAVNRGIPPERVQQHSRSEVRTVRLRNEPAGAGARHERFERDGKTLVVSRPVFTSTTVASGGLLVPPSADTVPSGSGPAAGGILRPTSRPQFGSTPSPNSTSVPQNNNAIEPRNNRSETRDRNAGRPSRESGATAVRLPVTQAQSESRSEPASTSPSSSSGVITVSGVRNTPVPVRTPTPIFSKPVVVEGPAYTPSRPVVGGLPQSSTMDSQRPNRPTSAWGSSTPQANRNSTAPTYRRTLDNNNVAVDSTPQRESRNSAPQSSSQPNYDNRPSRSSSPSFSPSAPVRIEPRVSTPAPPARPRYSPAPSTPVPRVESRPAPAQPAASRSQSQSDSGRGSPRSR